MKYTISLFIFFLLLCFSSKNAEAVLLQILHTNDTHSYLDGMTHNKNIGGMARLKSLIGHYKDQMKEEEGVETLVMDAGDFAEGNIYYMADNARKVFTIHNEMGYDVGALGNHDYLMGSLELNKILGEMDLKFPLLAANVEVSDELPNIQEKITPFTEFEIEGIKIGVLGLTTNEIFYKWRMENGAVKNPYKAAKHFEKILKKRGNDYIIALTHIGVLNDIKLAEKTSSIDLIIGGHSHTSLFSPSYGMNKAKKKIPIVQAGKHTEYLGRLILDLNKGRPLKIVSYELIPVDRESKDFKIDSLVAEADLDLENFYGKEWLNEKLAFSHLKIGDKEGSLKWAYFITDAIKEKVNAEIAIHSPLMNGENYPIGEITRRDLFNSIPRVYDVSEKYGWTIYTTKIRGIWLRLLFEAVTHFRAPLTFSGMALDYSKTSLGIKINHILVNKDKVNPIKEYTVAFTEGVVRGVFGSGTSLRRIFKKPYDTKKLIWTTLEEKILKAKDIFTSALYGKEDNSLNDGNHSFFMGDQEIKDVNEEETEGQK